MTNVRYASLTKLGSDAATTITFNNLFAHYRAAYSDEVVLDRRDLEIFVILDDAATNINLEVFAACGNRLRDADFSEDVLDLLLEAWCVLIAGEVRIVEGNVTTGDHRDFKALVGLEPLEELAESEGTLLKNDLVVVGVTFRDAGDGAAHDRVELLGLELDDVVGLREHDLRKGQVGEAILELGDIVEALSVLVDLVGDNAGDHGGGRGDGRNDLASDHLSLVAVALSDGIVASTKVGAGVDEVNVEVGVIILLEVGGQELAGVCAANAQTFEERSDDRLIIIVVDGASGGRAASRLAFLGLLRSLHGNNLAHVLGGGQGAEDLLALALVHGGHAEVGKDQVGAGPHEIEMEHVVVVKCFGSGAALGARPEGVARAIEMVLGEQVEQITDREIEVGTADTTRYFHDTGLISSFLDIDKSVDVVELGTHASGGRVLAEGGNEGLGSTDELASVLDTRGEQSVELITAPLDAVLDLVGEVTECAHGDGLLGRILRVTVGLGLVRHNHLRVSLGAESTRLKKGLAVPDALAIDVETRLDVIDGIDDEVEAFPEIIVEDILSFFSDEGLMNSHLEIGVHDLCFAACTLRLGMTNIGLTEEELTVQVGYFNVVIIGDSDGTSRATGETHEGHGLSVLAAESTGTNHESLGSTELLLNLATVDLDLVVVTTVHGLAVDVVTFWEGLEAVVVGPLLEGHILASELDDLLSDEASKHGAHGGNGARAISSDLADDALINFLDGHGTFSLVSSVEGFRSFYYLSEVSLGVSWVATFGITEVVDSANSEVKVLRSSHAEVVHVEWLEHAIGSAASGILSSRYEVFEGDLHGYIDILDETLTRVCTEVCSVEAELEAVGTGIEDLDGSSLIELCHALNLYELDVITVLISMALILVHVYHGVLTLLNAANNELAVGFTIFVGDGEVGTVVKEGVGRDTHSLCEDEALASGASELVDLGEASCAPEVLRDADHMEVRDHLVGELGEAFNLDVRVKLLELAHDSLSPGGVADVLLGDVEVAAEVGDRHLSGIVDLNRFGASQDKILGDFDTEAAAADDKHIHLDEFAHGLETKGADLARVKVRINLDFFDHY